MSDTEIIAVSPGVAQKIVVAFPLYRQVPASWFQNWFEMDIASVAAVVSIEGAVLTEAMGELVKSAFVKCPDFDRLVVFEHDVFPPTNAFSRIAQYEDQDIVGGMTFGHGFPHHLMVGTRVQVEPAKFCPPTADVIRRWAESPALYEVDAVAMGFTAIRRQVFENWDPTVEMWKPTPPMVGHDLHFCSEAKKQGFKVWVDSGIRCGHLSTTLIGYPHNQEAMAQYLAAAPDGKVIWPAWS